MTRDDTSDSTPVRIYLADPAIQPALIEAIRSRLPANWTLEEHPEGAHAILTENVDVSEQIIAAAGASLRTIVRLDTGRAIVAPTSLPVASLPDPARVGVAEHTVTLILALSRHLLWVSRQTAQQQWAPGRDQPILTDQERYTYNWIDLQDFGAIYCKTVGIVGMGYIGRAVASRLRNFGVRLIYTDVKRLDPAEEARLGVQWRTLDELLQRSDFVTLHHRFHEGPQGNDKQFGVREFGLMKPSAYFINTSRGRMVDEDALVEALRNGKIAGAGLDVFRYEPLPADHPLFDLCGDNVILTAHVAGTPDAEARQMVTMGFIEQVQAALY